MTASGKRVLAVASAGGHWTQLLRLRPAFAGCDLVYLTTDKADVAALTADRGPDGRPPRVYRVNDANRWDKLGVLRMAARVLWAVLRERPAVVISTGAAPGYFALRFGKLLGARTIWLDSIANAEELSMTGRMVERYADLYLTQWEHLASGGDGTAARGSKGRGAAFAGAVL